MSREINDGNLNIIGNLSNEGSLASTGFKNIKLTAVVGTSQTIIPNATDDVTNIVSGFFTLNDGSSSVANAFTLDQGGTTTYPIVVGGSTWTIALNANGSLTVSRTSGSGTATMTFLLTFQ